jgi:uncharacterized protein YkwD
VKRRTLVILAALTLLLNIAALSAIGLLVKAADNTPSAPTLSVEELWKLTNQNRQEPLLLDEHLDRSAQAKCQDMVTKNYYDHYAPDGMAPSTFIQHEIGVNPNQKIGENLVEVGGVNSHLSDKDIIDSWMGSPKHKENLQDVAYHKVGFAICETRKYPGYLNRDSIVVVQHLSS